MSKRTCQGVDFFQDSRRHQEEVEKMRRETEDRLRRAQNESIEVRGQS